MKKLSAMLVALVMVFVFVSGCSSTGTTEPAGTTAPAETAATAETAETTETASTKDTIVIGESSEWWGVDTNQLTGSSFTQTLTCDPLVSLNEQGEMAPCIASAVEVSEDGLTVTLTIPEGMYFASGEQLEPEDIVASIEYNREISPYAASLETIGSMDIDGRNVILHLTEYSSDFAVSLSSCFLNIQDKDVLDASSADDLLWGAQPYGPYYVVDYVQGASISLKANPGYVTYNESVENKGVALIENVTVRFITETFSMANALNVGDIDYIMSISYDGSTQITAENADFDIESTIPSLSYLILNTNSGPCADVNVRKAIARAINRNELTDAIHEMGVPAYTIVLDTVSNYNGDAADYFKANYDYDVEASKALLAEAGWTDTDGDGYVDKDGEPMSIKIVANKDGTTEDTVTQSLQIMLKEVGIDLQIELFAVYGHYNEITALNYDIGLCSWGWAEPLLLLNDGMSDLTIYTNTGIDEEYHSLISDLKSTVDYDTRTEIVGKIERLYSDNMIAIPLESMQFMSVDVGVEGILKPGNGMVFFNDMHFE